MCGPRVYGKDGERSISCLCTGCGSSSQQKHWLHPHTSAGPEKAQCWSALLGWTDPCTHWITVLQLFKATLCQQPSYHTISPSLKMATATLKPFLSPQAGFLQALPHYQKCTSAVLEYLILISSLEGCQAKYLHKLSTGREAVQPYSRHPLDVSSGTQGLTHPSLQ